MNKTAKIIISILIIYIISLLSFSGCDGTTEIIERVVTDTVVDTAYVQLPPEVITIYKPVPKYITEVRVDTVKEETILITENKIYQDTIVSCQNDSILQEISITGIRPTLDYSKVTLKKQERVITNTVTTERIVKDRKRLAFGIQAGYGYGLTAKQFTPYIGAGITLKF